MFKFLTSTAELHKLSKSLNIANVLLNEIDAKMNEGGYRSEFSDDMLYVAYILRKGTFDKLEKYRWRNDAKIEVPAIEPQRISIATALSKTIMMVNALSTQLNIFDKVQEILDNGAAYHEVDRKLVRVLSNGI